MAAVLKPERRTPEQRRAEKQLRSHNTLKPALAEKPKPRGLTQGKPKPEEQQNCFKTYRERKPWKGLNPGKGFAVQRGTRIKPRRFLDGLSGVPGHPEQSTLKRFALDRNAMRKLDRVKILKPIGVRGRRLLPGDRKQEAKSHILPCVCGCNAHLQPGADGIPGKGLIARAHLESRKYETTRNEDYNNLPGCAYLNHWLDQEATTRQNEDDTCKAVLLRKAREVAEKENGRRLTPEEVQPILSDHGYYTWLHSMTRI